MYNICIQKAMTPKFPYSSGYEQSQTCFQPENILIYLKYILFLYGTARFYFLNNISVSEHVFLESDSERTPK